MREIPNVTAADLAFGNVSFMPAWNEIPEEFKRWNGGPYSKAVSGWFFSGAKRDGDKLIAGGVALAPKEGVHADKALAAVRAVLASFEPKHEHKEAACAFLLSEWFDPQPAT